MADASPPPQPRWLRNSADRRVIAFTLLWFAFVAGQWWLLPRSIGDLGVFFLSGKGIMCLVLWALALFGALGASVAIHNVIHKPIFRSRALNGAFRVVLTFIYGQPASVFVPIHNRGHHKYMQTARDVTRTNRSQFRWNMLNFLLAGSLWSNSAARVARGFFADQRRKDTPLWRQFRVELVLLVGFWVLLLSMSWWKTLLVVVCANFFGQWAIKAINFCQHDGCDATSAFNHSRNLTGPIINYFLYNNGFHTIHHEWPGYHWSELPKLHDELVKPHIDPRLDEKNALAWWWRQFAWPGVRLRYDGQPVRCSPVQPDEPWQNSARQGA